MKNIKFISAFLLVLMSIANISCEDCEDEDDARTQEQNKTVTAIQKDSLNVKN